MDRLRRISPATRLMMAAVLALCLGIRLLTPPGFMPAFERGALAIVPCPDADGANLARAATGMPAMEMAGMAMDHAAQGHSHDGRNGYHETCPYAAAASLAGLDSAPAALAVPALLGPLSPVALALPAFLRHSTRERPPLRGPPLSA